MSGEGLSELVKKREKVRNREKERKQERVHVLFLFIFVYLYKVWVNRKIRPSQVFEVSQRVCLRALRNNPIISELLQFDNLIVQVVKE